MSSAQNSSEPIGYRAYVARAAANARPDPLHIESCTFPTREAARAWVEQARLVTRDPANFACSVTPVYGAPL
jgi:hypothetical protein